MLNDPLLHFVYKYIGVMWTEARESELNLFVCEDIKNSLFLCWREQSGEQSNSTQITS